MPPNLTPCALSQGISGGTPSAKKEISSGSVNASERTEDGQAELHA
jgi:hypothetical protein